MSLKLCNLFGGEVGTLVDEDLQPGQFETRFDESGLASARAAVDCKPNDLF